MIYEPPEQEVVHNSEGILRATPEPEVPSVPSKPAAEVLSFTLTADPGMAGHGDEVSMRVDFSNNGTQTLEGLRFTDHLEQGFEFVASTNPLLQVARKSISANIPALQAGKTNR